MPKTNVALDATVLSSLMSCARMVDFRFNQNMVRSDGKSNSLECGSLVHTIMEFFNKARIDGKNRADAIDIGYAAGNEYIRGYHEDNIYITEPTEKGMLNTPEEGDSRVTGWAFVFKTMEEYFDYYKNDSFTVIAAEETRKDIIFEDDDIRILWKAKFDAIIDTVQGFMSTDYKTMKQRRMTQGLNNQFMGQCFLLKSRNMMVDKIGFQKSLKVHEKFERAIISYSADRINEFANDVVPYYARMLAIYNESGVWPPNFTHCENKYGTCDYASVCEHDRNMRGKSYQSNL